MNLESTIKALKAVAKFTPEFEPASAEAETKDPLAALVNKYKQLGKYPVYLQCLKRTGGVHIHNQDFSLGLYGFGGYVVAAFDEGLFLDHDRYFRFGEVLYLPSGELNYVFAFDFQLETDVVLTSRIDESSYVHCANSFLALLDDFANGKYPSIGP